MKILEKTAKIWYLVIVMYLAPLILSISYILSTNRLLGDFTHSIVTDGHTEIIFAGAVYLLPLVCIIFISRVADRVRIGNFNGECSSYLYGMLITVTILAVIIGLPSVGESPGEGGISNIARTIILKFNPQIVFLLFAFSNTSTKRLVIGIVCIAVIGYEQKSLLPVFLIIIAILAHYVMNYSSSGLRLLIYTLMIVLAGSNIDTLLFELYQLRNNMRGSSAQLDFELVMSYALGRVNSFSSFYYIWSEGCCKNAPDLFYVAGTVLERIIGISLYLRNPSQIFNDEILGIESLDYGIFTSFAGALLIDGRASFFIIILSSITYGIFVLFAHKITPLPSNGKKTPLFLLLFYFPYLSGDVWEFSILIQSLIVIRLTIAALQMLRVRGAGGGGA